MNKSIATFFSIFIILSFVFLAPFQMLSANKKSNPRIQMQLQNVFDYNETTDALVLMKDFESLLGQTQHIQSKEKKGQFVYDLLTKQAEKSQADLQNWLRQQNLKFTSYYINNTLFIEDLSEEQLEALNQRTDIEQIKANTQIQNNPPKGSAFNLMTPEIAGVAGNITATKAPEVWTKFKTRGEGITIAGQDTGVDWTHPALKNQYRGFKNGKVSHDYNWHDAIHAGVAPFPNPCGLEIQEPCDDDAHGTHTVGTIVGEDKAANETIGMAPGADWIACRNMEQGAGTPATYIECFEFFLAPYAYKAVPAKDGKPELAPHVINNSWGCPDSEGCGGEEFNRILEALKAAGIFVVVSAGNDGPSCATITDPPASVSGLTFSVGAYDHKTGKIAGFSSRGPSKLDQAVGPDISAPGVNIRSAIPHGEYGEYGWSGTSMAGPHVVGLVALMWSAQPKLIGQIDQTIDLIQKTAIAKTTSQNCGGTSGQSIPNNTFGYGVMDALAAVTAAQQIK